MNKVSFLIGLFLMGILFSCEQSTNDIDSTTSDDSDLISAIQSAKKTTISEDGLPTSSTSVLNTNYSESYVNQAFVAAELGYEVKMRKKQGAQAGELANVYFDINGKKLTTKEEAKAKHKPKKGPECFTLVFPVDFTMPDGTTVITVENESGFDAIKTWFDENPDSKGKPEINFPVDVTYTDGTVVTIASDEEMKAAIEECREERPSCFEFVFPITVTMPDGTEIVGNNKEEMNTAVKDWYTANPDIKERPAITFPVDVVLADESVVTITTEEEMKELKSNCKDGKGKGKGKDKGGKKCFELVFPVSFEMPDGTTITANSKEEKDELLKAWHEANPEIEEKGTLVFPVDIEYKDGTTETISSEEEMKAAKEACRESKGEKGPKGKKCFELVFPATFEMPDGTAITANNNDEAHEAIKAWHEANPEVEEKGQLVFPVEISYEDGTTKTINSEEEMKTAKEACREGSKG